MRSLSLVAMMAIMVVLLASVYIYGRCSSPDRNETPEWRVDTKELMKVSMPDGLPQRIVAYEGMDVDFNPQLHIPNYVAWELTADETHGDVPRLNKFMNDPEVDGCAETWDYSYSGYDRGHMAPAADMKWSREAMRQTFYLTNICPQAKALNTGAWNRLEANCRKWAQRDSSLIIICGPILTDKIDEFIGDNRVAVPKRFFKVVLAPFTQPMSGIGFIMPNDRVEGGIQAAAVSIDSVESATGYDFFSALPDHLEKEVEKQCDFHKWNSRR